VGTDPRQGAALARAILEALAESGAIVIATTHYSELKKLASTDRRFVNASVSFDSETLMPTYRLLVGIPGASHALDIAQRYGIPEKIAVRARMLLDESELSAEALIEKVHMLDEELYREKELFRQLKAELEREKAQLEETKRKTYQMQAEKGAAAGREFLAEINRLREMLIQKEKELQGADFKKLASLRQEIAEAEKQAHDMIVKSELEALSENLIPLDAKLAGKGSDVFVFSLKQWGKIEDIDVEKKMVSVIMGNSLKSRFPFGELYTRKELPNKKKSVVRSAAAACDEDEGFVPVTIQTSYNTVDLRGKRVDDALAQIDASLDTMSRSGIRCAVIIHGHGTGALKEAVRKALKFSTYVIAHRPGEMGEGGDGVTIALLRN
jgi:DNA mismatch repair protein MutS2